MSATLPAGLASFPPLKGLHRIHQGKVRDTYALPHHPRHRLVLATDRISIYDFVLKADIQDKGKNLQALNVFWRLGPLKGFSSDLVAYGCGIDKYLPTELRGNPELQARASVVETLEMVPIEAIVRGYLTGSGLKPYREHHGVVCGQTLPLGLEDGDQLPSPLFTPSTKAEIGHDEHLPVAEVEKRYGHELVALAQLVYKQLSQYAATRGVILVDSKFEFGYGQDETGRRVLRLADEVGTPDSSRYWKQADWLARTRGQPPPAYDKQFVRNAGKLAGLHRLDPQKPEDVLQAHAFKLPAEVIAQTQQLYRQIFIILTGVTLEDFQRDQMGIRVSG